MSRFCAACAVWGYMRMKVLYQDQRFRAGASQISERGFTILGVFEPMSGLTSIMAELSTIGHIVYCADTMAEALAHARHLPDLVVVDLTLQGSPSPVIEALRRLSPPARLVPVLASAPMTTDHDSLIDAVLPDLADLAAVMAAIVAWSPVGLLAGITRLAEAFGAGEINALAGRFQMQLVDAVAALDTTPDRSAAHRIAGIAGTLGFARLGQSWLAVSEGDGTMCEAARREARVAIYALARAAHARGVY